MTTPTPQHAGLLQAMQSLNPRASAAFATAVRPGAVVRTGSLGLDLPKPSSHGGMMSG